MKQKIKEMLKLTAVPAVIASLCCLSPILLVSLGIVSVSVAGEVSNTLYGKYKWLFRIAGLIALIIFVIAHLRRKKNICTLDEAKKRRNEIINTVALALITSTVLYIIFLYGIVEFVGMVLHVW